MKVWAIILDYRHSAMTLRCLDSLAGQVDHVWVVDNGASADDSNALREGLAHRPSSPPTTLLQPGRNLGFAAGVNHALRASVGAAAEAFLLLNNDAVLGSGAVSRLAEALDSCGGRALVAPARTDQGMPLRLWYQPLLGLVTRLPTWGAFPYLSGACLLVPAALARGGLFDESFFMYGEDVELAWRQRRAGIELVTLEDVPLAHRGSTTAPHGGTLYEYHTARAHLLLARKLASGTVERWLFLAGRACALPARAALRSIRFRTVVPLAALWRAAIARDDQAVTAP